MTLKPNRTIFFLSTALIPWIIVGLRFGSTAIYMSVVLAILDFKYWTKFCGRILTFLPTFWFGLLSLGALTFVLRSHDPWIALGKISLAICYVQYLKDGLQNYGTAGLRCGLGLAVGLAVAQFFEANFYHTSFLATRPLAEKYASSIPLFVLYDQGLSYAPGLFNSLIRVSGSAPEPGYFSAILTAFAPLFCTKHRVWLLVILIGLLVSLSKVTLVQIALTPVCYLAAIFLPLPLALPLLFGAFATITWQLVPGVTEISYLYTFGRTYFDRIFPVFVYKDLGFWDQIFGVGYSHGCHPLKDYSFIEAPDTLGRFATFFYEGDCLTFGFSSIGSFLIENGAIGVIFITLFLTVFRLNFSRNKQKVSEARRQRLIADFCFLQFFVASMSVHYLTLFPAFFVVVAYGLSLCKVKNTQQAKQEYWRTAGFSPTVGHHVYCK